jgi:hypothetical protein
MIPFAMEILYGNQGFDIFRGEHLALHIVSLVISNRHINKED